jgi:hypothetical protein
MLLAMLETLEKWPFVGDNRAASCELLSGGVRTAFGSRRATP